MNLKTYKKTIIERLKKGDKVKITMTATIDCFVLYINEDGDRIEFDNPISRLPFDENIDLEIIKLRKEED